jgi:hypothetical protein
MFAFASYYYEREEYVTTQGVALASVADKKQTCQVTRVKG